MHPVSPVEGSRRPAPPPAPQVRVRPPRQLQVHHLSYDHAGDGKEPDRDLLTLCRRHHELAHEYERSGQYGQPYAGRTLRKATEAMVRDQTAPGGCTPVRAWVQRLIGRRPG